MCVEEKAVVKTRSGEAGFTLVELAIVMIIIGLLIGGVLKGQQLIETARLTSTMQQITAIDSALSTFRDVYRFYPGDILTPGTRLPGCGAAPCNVAGDGDNLIELANTNTALGAAMVLATEGVRSFAHLYAAGLISGVGDFTVALAQAFGNHVPAAEIGGGFNIGFYDATAQPSGNAGALTLRSGHYIYLLGQPGSDVDAAGINQPLTATGAERIDRKFDDGNPLLGTVQAGGLAACIVAGPPALYNGANAGNNCSVFVRLQG